MTKQNEKNKIYCESLFEKQKIQKRLGRSMCNKKFNKYYASKAAGLAKYRIRKSLLAVMDDW